MSSTRGKPIIKVDLERTTGLGLALPISFNLGRLR